jgi:hypothetical protein
MTRSNITREFHQIASAQGTVKNALIVNKRTTKITYSFNNHFHPFVDKLLEQLNRKSIDGLLDINFHEREDLIVNFFESFYLHGNADEENEGPREVWDVEYFPKKIDTDVGGPYSIYNWELLFHVPLTIAVHLSKNQRFAEAQKWFHYIFDPTTSDTEPPNSSRFWRFIGFRQVKYDLQLMECDSTDEMPNTGEARVFVAKMDSLYHARIFNSVGRTAVDREFNPDDVDSELRAELDDALNSDEIDDRTKHNLIAKITSILDYDCHLDGINQIDAQLRIFSRPDGECTAAEIKLKEIIKNGYEAVRKNPFQPHVVARTRFLAYQYCVLMKYLDNLIAWGDSLFRQDSMESINEATQLYVLAANLLGPKPQKIPRQGITRPKTFAELRNGKHLDRLGNTLVELEGQFPFNLYSPETEKVDTNRTSPLFGMGRTLYFCIPPNDKLLGYWDTVGDRLFKIRHCMNIEGVVRQLPLFQPPIDPGMLVKAAAAGIDVNSIVSGLNQPLSPVRSALLMQQAMTLCNEVRGMGNALLTVLEKKDNEALTLLRQKHEVNIQTLVQDVRLLQWKAAIASTESLLKSRDTALERFRYYQRLLGQKKDPESTPETFALKRDWLDLDSSEDSELTDEEIIDKAYEDLVKHYDKQINKDNRVSFPKLRDVPQEAVELLALDLASFILETGDLHLSLHEFLDLNVLGPAAQLLKALAAGVETASSVVIHAPDSVINLKYWGLGGDLKITGGEKLKESIDTGASVIKGIASVIEMAATYVNKTANYQRRADEWRLQHNLAARELMQIGRQIIGSLIAEQVARHEYLTIQKQIEQAEEIQQVLQDKFTNEELYSWMQGELSKLYYEYYKFAFDIARKAEQTMKHELMRPELDEMTFIKFNYWDGGRKGLLSGEALYLDLKRMEMAYHDHNKREYELTKHISLRQLDPIALLSLKATGTCEVTLPEWLFDLDCPGHYMRRIKTVSLTIPSVTGPYTSVNCTLTLLKSTLRHSPVGSYARDPDEDSRFVDYYGTIQSVVTSSAQNDSGLFETNVRDERFLPFEGAGAESTWRLELPSEFRQFDYTTIADVILHLRYTARPGGQPLKDGAIGHLEEQLQAANEAGLTRLFSLKHDFPSEWHQFMKDTGDFTATLKASHFPYFVQPYIQEQGFQGQHSVHAIDDNQLISQNLGPMDISFDENGDYEFSLSRNDVLSSDRPQVFMVIQYSLPTG